MPLDEPRWWYGETRGVPWQARALRPVGRIYGSVVERRFQRAEPYRSRLPVICVGNLTAGGTGKTPLSLMIGAYLKSVGQNPVFLTRGYRGRMTGPLWVDVDHHTARDVGDEPLLLARAAPVVVARDRKAGARLIESGERPASVIVMDDGLQNPALAKDLTSAVVDAVRGIGNGEVIPAGPLRAPLDFQLLLVDCIVKNGKASTATGSVYEQFRQNFPGPVLCAAIAPADDAGWLKGERLVAYAGIGNPGRLFSLLQSLGGVVVEQIAFPDHHDFTNADAARLLEKARAHDAVLVTTEKDLARLSGEPGPRGELARASKALAVRMLFEAQDQERLAALIEAALKKSKLA